MQLSEPTAGQSNRAMERWQRYSSDPNAGEVIELRRSVLAKARSRQLIEDRIEYLCKLAAGKSVLDVGVIEHHLDATGSPTWLHGHLHRCAASCVGVDILENDVKQLQERGYDVRLADITQQPLPQKFDVIIAGEVLEHVDAPGTFLKSCAAMLAPGGRLAIAVPNPWYANVMLKNLFGRKTFVDSADHVGWYEASVLYELGQRHGLELVRVTGIGQTNAKTLKSRLFFLSRPVLMKLGVSAELFAKSIIYEFVLAGEEADPC